MGYTANATNNNICPLMLNSIYRPVIRSRRFPPMFCLSAGAFLGVLLTAFVLGGRAHQAAEQWLVDYGATTAELVASQAMQAALERDLVSLHATLQQVVDRPRVVMITVHDADRALLVQAGQSAPALMTREFTSNVVLDRQFAGVVTLTLDAEIRGQRATYWALAAILLLLVIMAALSLYECYGEIWYWRKPEPESEDHGTDISDHATPLVNKPAHGAAEASGHEPDEAHSTLAAAAVEDGLLLTLVNHQRLHAQLNGERFEQLLDFFHSALDRVLSIYNGYRLGDAAENGSVEVRLHSGEDRSEALFKAVCCSQLLRELLAQGKVQWRLQALIYPADEDDALSQAPADPGVFVSQSLSQWLPTDRLSLSDDDMPYRCVSAVDEAYEILLTQQREQIAAMN